MAEDAEPLQTEEVVRALEERTECTLVHRASGHEVDIFTDTDNSRAPWRVRYSHSEILDKAVLKQALSLGFELCAVESMRETRYELSRNCVGVRAAAMRALRLARTLPGVSPDAWLWVTVYAYGDRGVPPAPPNPWPPGAA